MLYSPTFGDFADLAQTHTIVPIYRRLIGDTLTPVTAFCKIQEGDQAFLFESVVGGEKLGRYSFVGAGPFLRFEAFDRRVKIQTSDGQKQEFTHPDPLRKLEELLTAYRAPHVAGLPRFCGGAVGYAGYDTVRYVEKLPNAPEDDRRLPDLSFSLYDRMVIFDHINKSILVVANAHVDQNDLQGSYDKACRQADRLVERLQQGVADLQLTDISPVGEVTLPFTSNFTKAGFEAAVRKCQEYIFAGDIFQVVLSQRLRAQTRARPFDIYRALRVINPSPFMFFIKNGSTHLIGASPEIMTRVENGHVTIRPLAGTRKRGATPEEDQRLAEELLADPKERAEHIMLVDLGRNDVGVVSEFGSVRLGDLLTVERYSHVMHLSSTVTGQLDKGKTAFDALRSCLPAGTLSGAPKVRAMQIIDELEPHRRGPYGGAVGYVDYSGNMDTCIALRTMVLLGQTAYVQAGAGIVADSEPEMEFRETMNKAMGLLRALEMAETQL
ncbi:MAG: anthranilate synthase component I [Planctomycetes bacterium]|nr:anthranilate synthase component I [Planctomycetota bacterium]